MYENSRKTFSHYFSYTLYIPVLCTGAGREEDAEVDNEGQDESAIILMWINWEQSAIFHVY